MREREEALLRRRGVNPPRPRWCEPGPSDERCDVCQVETVPFHDVILCGHSACYWDIQVCEACGGFDRAEQLMVKHLAECAIASASDGVYDFTRRELVFPSPQLGLFAQEDHHA